MIRLFALQLYALRIRWFIRWVFESTVYMLLKGGNAFCNILRSLEYLKREVGVSLALLALWQTQERHESFLAQNSKVWKWPWWGSVRNLGFTCFRKRETHNVRHSIYNITISAALCPMPCAPCPIPYPILSHWPYWSALCSPFQKNSRTNVENELNTPNPIRT